MKLGKIIFCGIAFCVMQALNGMEKTIHVTTYYPIGLLTSVKISENATFETLRIALPSHVIDTNRTTIFTDEHSRKLRCDQDLRKLQSGATIYLLQKSNG